MLIAFRVPDLVAPSGGLAYLYRVARAMHEAGHETVLAHDSARFRHAYEDADDVPVVSVRSLRRSPPDVLVLPEILVAEELRAPVTVMVNQNPFLTGGPAADARYRASGTTVIATSAYTERYLRARLPDIAVVRTVVGVDTALFVPPSGPRARTIAWMPRKRRDDADLVVPWAAVDGWTDTPIDVATPAQVAAGLAGAKLFLALGEREGLGLPVAEAMACGTPCVGFTGVGGDELLTRDTGWPVPEGDVAGLLVTAAAVRERIDAGDPEVPRRAAAARELVAGSFTRGHEQAAALAAFTPLR